ncbi:MAG: hypothetical protein U0996_18855 [Planctomycetaceae bacterium]
MSRAYRISVSESLRKLIRGSDHVCTDIELLEVLPREQMAALLESELLKSGFQKDGEVLVRSQDKSTISIDSKTGRVTVTTELCEDVELKNKVDGWGDADFGKDGRGKLEQQLREQAKSNLASQASAKEEQLGQKATEHLEGVLRDLQKELDGVVNRVTGQALKQKAAQLGEIKSITEDTETGSMTIVLEV